MKGCADNIACNRNFLSPTCTFGALGPKLSHQRALQVPARARVALKHSVGHAPLWRQAAGLHCRQKMAAPAPHKGLQAHLAGGGQTRHAAQGCVRARHAPWAL